MKHPAGKLESMDRKDASEHAQALFENFFWLLPMQLLLPPSTAISLLPVRQLSGFSDTAKAS